MPPNQSTWFFSLCSSLFLCGWVCSCWMIADACCWQVLRVLNMVPTTSIQRESTSILAQVCPFDLSPNDKAKRISSSSSALFATLMAHVDCRCRGVFSLYVLKVSFNEGTYVWSASVRAKPPWVSHLGAMGRGLIRGSAKREMGE